MGVRALAGQVENESSSLQTTTDLIGTTVSGVFLYLIGIINLVIRATASLPIPTRAARLRVVQCVEPSAGNSVRVSRSTSPTVPGGSQDLRPRPFGDHPDPGRAFAANRFRHRRTGSGSTPLRRAISSLATPSPAHNNARA